MDKEKVEELFKRIHEESFHNFTIHDTFQAIAEARFQSSMDIGKVRVKELLSEDSDNHKKIFKCVSHYRKHYHGLIETLVFSSMALEAFINYYITHLTSEEEFLKRYSTRSLKDKWLNVPKELKGITFDEESDAVIRFKKTIDARNSLFHFKSKTLKGGEYSKAHNEIIDAAKNALTSVKEMRELLNKMDPPLVGLLSGLEIWKRP